MARPRKSEDKKKVRVNLTISPGAREASKLLDMNLSSILEQAIRLEYENIKLNKNNGMKVYYTEDKWKEIIENELLN